jgi:hypothetical protein
MLSRVRTHLSWRLDEMARRRVNLPKRARGTRFATGYAEQAAFEDRAKSVGVGDLEAYFDGHREGPGIWKWRHY